MYKKRVLILGASSALGIEVVRQLFAAGEYELHGTHSGRGCLDPWPASMLSSVTPLDLEYRHDLEALEKGRLFAGMRFDEVFYFIGVASAGYPALQSAARERVLNLNHVLTMQAVRAVVNHHLAPGARLTVTSSAAAWWDLEYAPGYCLAKARLNESLNELAGEGIAVTCWAPGAIATDLWEADGIPAAVQAAIRWLAPSPLWAVRHLLRHRLDEPSAPARATLILTTADAWLSYHVPGVAAVINFALSGLVEADGYFKGRETRLTGRAMMVLPVYVPWALVARLGG